MTMADDGVPCAQQRPCVVKNAAGEWREEGLFHTHPCIVSVVQARPGQSDPSFSLEFPVRSKFLAGVSSGQTARARRDGAAATDRRRLSRPGALGLLGCGFWVVPTETALGLRLDPDSAARNPSLGWRLDWGFWHLVWVSAGPRVVSARS